MTCKTWIKFTTLYLWDMKMKCCTNISKIKLDGLIHISKVSSKWEGLSKLYKELKFSSWSDVGSPSLTPRCVHNHESRVYSKPLNVWGGHIGTNESDSYTKSNLVIGVTHTQKVAEREEDCWILIRSPRFSSRSNVGSFSSVTFILSERYLSFQF